MNLNESKILSFDEELNPLPDKENKTLFTNPLIKPKLHACRVKILDKYSLTQYRRQETTIKLHRNVDLSDSILFAQDA